MLTKTFLDQTVWALPMVSALLPGCSWAGLGWAGLDSWAGRHLQAVPAMHTSPHSAPPLPPARPAARDVALLPMLSADAGC